MLQTNRVNRRNAHPVLYAVAAGLAVILFLTLLLRMQSPLVELDRADWRCSASHGEKHQEQRADGWMEFKTVEICDQWSRKGLI